MLWFSNLASKQIYLLRCGHWIHLAWIHANPWQRVSNALGHWFSQHLFTKGRNNVHLGIYYCFPFYNISNTMHSPGIWRGPVMWVPIFAMVVVVTILSSFSSPLEDVSSFWHWRGMTISLLLGYDYYLSACKGVCVICLPLNFRRNCKVNPDPGRWSVELWWGASQRWGPA